MKKVLFLAVLILGFLPCTKAQQAGNQCRDLGSGASPLLVSPKNYLWVEATGTFSSAIFTVQWVIRNPDGTISFNSKVLPSLTATNQGVGANAQLTDGCMISASVTMQSSPPIYTGQCYVQLYVLPTSNHTIGQLGLSLLGGYMNSNYTLSWPARQDNAASGPGFNETLTVGNPAAGVNFTKTFNAAQRFRIVNVRFQLVTSATVASRQVCIKFTDPSSNLYMQRCVQGTQPASQTNQYDFSVGGNNDLLTAATLIAIPAADEVQTGLASNIEFSDATVLASNILNIQAGDQISLVTIRVMDWHEND